MSEPMSDFDIDNIERAVAVANTAYSYGRAELMKHDIPRLIDDLRRARDALPPAGKLEGLADWIDVKYPNDPHPEVQRDLRKWAAAIRAALPAGRQ